MCARVCVRVRMSVTPCQRPLQSRTTIRYESTLRGADSSVVESLPIVTYKRSEGAATSDQDGNLCVVCRDEFEEGDGVRVLPCFHTFHVRCIDPWLFINKTCPVCHTNVYTDV